LFRLGTVLMGGARESLGTHVVVGGCLRGHHFDWGVKRVVAPVSPLLGEGTTTDQVGCGEGRVVLAEVTGLSVQRKGCTKK